MNLRPLFVNMVCGFDALVVITLLRRGKGKWEGRALSVQAEKRKEALLNSMAWLVAGQLDSLRELPRKEHGILRLNLE